MSPFKLHLFDRSADHAAADNVGADADPAHVLPADPSCDTEAGGASASKISQIIAAISTSDGATVEELASVSGWQLHTIRAALSRLRRRGFPIKLVTVADGRKAYRHEVRRG